jgi:hypothetical protein
MTGHGSWRLALVVSASGLTRGSSRHTGPPEPDNVTIRVAAADGAAYARNSATASRAMSRSSSVGMA